MRLKLDINCIAGKIKRGSMNVESIKLFVKIQLERNIANSLIYFAL